MMNNMTKNRSKDHASETAVTNSPDHVAKQPLMRQHGGSAPSWIYRHDGRQFDGNRNPKPDSKTIDGNLKPDLHDEFIDNISSTQTSTAGRKTGLPHSLERVDNCTFGGGESRTNDGIGVARFGSLSLTPKFQRKVDARCESEGNNFTSLSKSGSSRAFGGKNASRSTGSSEVVKKQATLNGVVASPFVRQGTLQVSETPGERSRSPGRVKTPSYAHVRSNGNANATFNSQIYHDVSRRNEIVRVPGTSGSGGVSDSNVPSVGGLDIVGKTGVGGLDVSVALDRCDPVSGEAGKPEDVDREAEDVTAKTTADNGPLKAGRGANLMVRPGIQSNLKPPLPRQGNINMRTNTRSKQTEGRGKSYKDIQDRPVTSDKNLADRATGNDINVHDRRSRSSDGSGKIGKSGKNLRDKSGRPRCDSGSSGKVRNDKSASDKSASEHDRDVASSQSDSCHSLVQSDPATVPADGNLHRRKKTGGILRGGGKAVAVATKRLGRRVESCNQGNVCGESNADRNVPCKHLGYGKSCSERTKSAKKDDRKGGGAAKKPASVPDIFLSHVPDEDEKRTLIESGNWFPDSVESFGARSSSSFETEATATGKEVTASSRNSLNRTNEIGIPAAVSDGVLRENVEKSSDLTRRVFRRRSNCSDSERIQKMGACVEMSDEALTSRLEESKQTTATGEVVVLDRQTYDEMLYDVGVLKLTIIQLQSLLVESSSENAKTVDVDLNSVAEIGDVESSETVSGTSDLKMRSEDDAAAADAGIDRHHRRICDLEKLVLDQQRTINLLTTQRRTPVSLVNSRTAVIVVPSSAADANAKFSEAEVCSNRSPLFVRPPPPPATTTNTELSVSVSSADHDSDSPEICHDNRRSGPLLVSHDATAQNDEMVLNHIDPTEENSSLRNDAVTEECLLSNAVSHMTRLDVVGKRRESGTDDTDRFGVSGDESMFDYDNENDDDNEDGNDEIGKTTKSGRSSFSSRVEDLDGKRDTRRIERRVNREVKDMESAGDDVNEVGSVGLRVEEKNISGDFSISNGPSSETKSDERLYENGFTGDERGSPEERFSHKADVRDDGGEFKVDGGVTEGRGATEAASELDSTEIRPSVDERLPGRQAPTPARSVETPLVRRSAISAYAGLSREPANVSLSSREPANVGLSSREPANVVLSSREPANFNRLKVLARSSEGPLTNGETKRFYDDNKNNGNDDVIKTCSSSNDLPSKTDRDLNSKGTVASRSNLRAPKSYANVPKNAPIIDVSKMNATRFSVMNSALNNNEYKTREEEEPDSLSANENQSQQKPRSEFTNENRGQLNLTNENRGQPNLISENRGQVNSTNDNRGHVNLTNDNRGHVNSTNDNRGQLNSTNENRGQLNSTNENLGQLNSTDENHRQPKHVVRSSKLPSFKSNKTTKSSALANR